MRGMKAYGKLAKDQTLSKRVLLEHAFEQADKSGDRAITIAEFVGYLGGAEDNKLSVKPELFAEIAGFVKPDGMEYEIPEERRKKKGRWVEDEAPVVKPGRNPDGSRIVNFMSTQPADAFLAGPSGSNNAGQRGPGAKGGGGGGGAAAAANAVRPKRGGFMDRMAERAAVGVGQMSNMLGEIDLDEGVDAAKRMGDRACDRAVVSAAGGTAGRGPAGQTDSIMAKSQARALDRRREATQSKDPLKKLRSTEEERRNEEAIERMALKRQNRANVGSRGVDAGNFVKKHVDARACGSGNDGMATRGMDKVLGKVGGGQVNKFLSTLAT